MNSAWEDEHVGVWDIAVRGSDAAGIAYQRAFCNESAVLFGMEAVQTGWDLEKFYDTIAIQNLVREAKRLDYLLRLLTISLQVHLSARWLRVGATISDGIKPCTSIMAGCAKSNTFARIATFNLMAWMRTGHPAAPMQQYVDDMIQRAEGTKRYIMRILPKAVQDFATKVELQLRISIKASMVCSTGGLAQELKKCMIDLSIPIAITAEARDLGAIAAGGKQRRQKLIRWRFARAQRRAERIWRLAGIYRKAAKLYATGVAPPGRICCECHGAGT